MTLGCPALDQELESGASRGVHRRSRESPRFMWQAHVRPCLIRLHDMFELKF
jgi:hypothetical protein